MWDRTCDTVFVLTYALMALLFFSSNLRMTLNPKAYSFSASRKRLCSSAVQYRLDTSPSFEESTTLAF